MKSINTSKISGAQELLPETQAVFNKLKLNIANTYHLYGFQEIETPFIERTEILLAKAGGDTEKQIYKLVKTGDKSVEAADQALRFDHTVPLARYVVEHENELIFPFKVSQLGVNFRGERAQKGRFREFYQCDIDIIGRNELSIAYDSEVITTLLATFKTFDLNTPVLARISNRKIVIGLIESLNLTDKATEIMNIIDHAEKVTEEQTKFNLEELGLTKQMTANILSFINLNGNRSKVINELNNLKIDNSTFKEGVTELDQVLYLLESTDADYQIQADMKIIRGLDYYTGTVFEFILPEYPNIGSVAGGGRYDNLTKHFSNKSFPGVGGSIGLTRLFYVLNEENLLNPEIYDLLDYAVIPLSEFENDEAINVANKLRNKNHSTTVVLTNKKLGDKVTYASKIAKNCIVIGPEEVKTKSLQSKNFQTGEVTDLNIEVISNPEDFWGN